VDCAATVVFDFARLYCPIGPRGRGFSDLDWLSATQLERRIGHWLRTIGDAEGTITPSSGQQVAAHSPFLLPQDGRTPNRPLFARPSRDLNLQVRIFADETVKACFAFDHAWQYRRITLVDVGTSPYGTRKPLGHARRQLWCEGGGRLRLPSVVHPPNRRLGAIVNADLAKDRLDMNLHGSLGDIDFPGDSLVGIAFNQAAQDQFFPWRKLRCDRVIDEDRLAVAFTRGGIDQLVPIVIKNV